MQEEYRVREENDGGYTLVKVHYFEDGSLFYSAPVDVSSSTLRDLRKEFQLMSLAFKKPVMNDD